MKLPDMKFLGLTVAAFLILAVLWQTGTINLPPKLAYGLRLLQFKITQPGKVAGQTIVKLPGQFDKQDYSLSCEIATLKMALAVYGIAVSEDELIDRLPFDETPKSKGVWGDPDKGFVGRIDGQMPQNGYGVYAGPIAELASNWKRAEIITDGSVEQLATHLLAGRPIIVWGFYGRGNKLSWKTPAGKDIKAINGEHTRLVVGFSGDASGPDGFHLIDPQFGPMYWSSKKFVKNWEALGKMGVVIYAD